MGSSPFFSAAALSWWVADGIGAGRACLPGAGKGGSPLCQRAAYNASQGAQCTGTVRIIAPSQSEGSASLNIGTPDRWIIHLPDSWLIKMFSLPDQPAPKPRVSSVFPVPSAWHMFVC